ncbi:hypothetical protein [Flavobacterium sp. ZB4R12]|uniref:hypothetical protein n=1 Tax=Flavobacterium sp. ZB4R12 TaxID=3398732 RepID=UPI003AB0C0B2
MKYKIIVIAFLFSLNSFSQSDVNGRMKTEIVEKHELGYALHIPANTKEKKPLIIFLHGSGEKGSDIEKVKNSWFFQILKKPRIRCLYSGPAMS